MHCLFRMEEEEEEEEEEEGLFRANAVNEEDPRRRRMHSELSWLQLLRQIITK